MFTTILLNQCRSKVSIRASQSGLCGLIYCQPRTISSNANADLIVSILGPPNAGKSTLFNRLMCKESNRAYRLGSDKKKTRSNARIGYRSPSKRSGGAIVTPVAGTTRDRRECIGRVGGTTFRLVDTAGVDGEKIDLAFGKQGKHSLDGAMIRQTMEAAKQSDVVFLMFDARLGVTSDLAETVRWLRKLSHTGDQQQHREIVILANKLEGDRWASMDSTVLDNLAEVSRAGFGEPIPISAEHGEGMVDVAEIIDRLTQEKRQRLGLPLTNEDTYEKKTSDNNEKPLQLAILGRQNVGKSTLVNSLLGEERVIAGDTPGLTRDSISVPWLWKGKPVQIVDTAGIRRGVKRERSDEIEDLAVLDAMRAMKLADVAVLVLDAQAQYIQRQELAIADSVVREGRALVVAANKMDLVVDKDYTKHDFAKAVQEQIEIRFPMLRKTPVVAMSSLLGHNVKKLMPTVFEARDRWARVIPTGMLNRWLKDVLDEHSPPSQAGRATKIKYIIQTKGRPPTFLLFCNVSELPVNYLRYLTRHFQDSFNMFGMEVRLVVKKSDENPYANKSNKKTFVGIGGWKGRQKRMISRLKKTGMPTKKGKRGKKSKS
jgi:GTP-binding protein